MVHDTKRYSLKHENDPDLCVVRPGVNHPVVINELTYAENIIYSGLQFYRLEISGFVI